MKKVCLVIGAGAGIGGSVGRKFAREGYHAALCRRSDQEGLDKLVADAARARERLNGLAAERKALVGRLEGLVSHYCACFARQPYHVHRMGFCPTDGPGKARG